MPEGTKAVANGVETGRRTRHGRTKWTYVMRQPMATELTQIAVGNWDFSAPQRHHGVILRDVTAPSVTAVLQPAARRSSPASSTTWRRASAATRSTSSAA